SPGAAWFSRHPAFARNVKCTPSIALDDFFYRDCADGRFCEQRTHDLTRIEQIGNLRDGRDRPRGRTPCDGKPRGRWKSREVAVTERERTHQCAGKIMSQKEWSPREW